MGTAALGCPRAQRGLSPRARNILLHRKQRRPKQIMLPIVRPPEPVPLIQPDRRAQERCRTQKHPATPFAGSPLLHLLDQTTSDSPSSGARQHRHSTHIRGPPSHHARHSSNHRRPRATPTTPALPACEPASAPRSKPSPQSRREYTEPHTPRTTRGAPRQSPPHPPVPPPEFQSRVAIPLARLCAPSRFPRLTLSRPKCRRSHTSGRIPAAPLHTACDAAPSGRESSSPAPAADRM